MEVLDDCPDDDCYPISHEDFTTNGLDPAESAIAAGTYQGGLEICNDSDIFTRPDLARLRFQRFIDRDAGIRIPWVPLPDATISSRRIIYSTALHEFGHLMQLMHVRPATSSPEPRDLMEVIYDPRATINDGYAAEGGIHVASQSLTVTCNDVIGAGVPESCTMRPVTSQNQTMPYDRGQKPVSEGFLVLGDRLTGGAAVGENCLVFDLLGREVSLLGGEVRKDMIYVLRCF